MLINPLKLKFFSKKKLIGNFMAKTNNKTAHWDTFMAEIKLRHRHTRENRILNKNAGGFSRFFTAVIETWL